MGMPITVEVIDAAAGQEDMPAVFEYFEYVDKTFSTYKPDSEMSRINAGEIAPDDFSRDMKQVFALAADTAQRTGDYFDIRKPGGEIDPSGLVKGWAIYNAAEILRGKGRKDFYIEAGGDIEASGLNAESQNWKVGIRNPFNPAEIVKVVSISNAGLATSGTYLRGQHIYDPHRPGEPINEIVSLTVIGPNVYEADRFATAAFAMGRAGIKFIENLAGFEGYLIDSTGIATMTSGFETFTNAHA